MVQLNKQKFKHRHEKSEILAKKPSKPTVSPSKKTAGGKVPEKVMAEWTAEVTKVDQEVS
jgi:hypothetical protein